MTDINIKVTLKLLDGGTGTLLLPLADMGRLQVQWVLRGIGGGKFLDMMCLEWLVRHRNVRAGDQTSHRHVGEI